MLITLGIIVPIGSYAVYVFAFLLQIDIVVLV